MVKLYIGYIYKITNTINNKCYIGQTIKSIQTRFKLHISRAIKHKIKSLGRFESLEEAIQARIEAELKYYK